jgi:hypothetical protein
MLNNAWRNTMETSGKALVEHWQWAAEKGLMNLNTAHTYRAACLQVLSSAFPDDWEEIDTKKLDANEVFDRFQNLRGKDLTPRSLQDYKRRFQQALASFLAYASDPAAWKGPGRERPARQEGSPQRGQTSTRRSFVQRDFGENENLVEYPFPIRDLTARLSLPRDLKVAEAKRLTAFIMSLAIDSEAS